MTESPNYTHTNIATASLLVYFTLNNLKHETNDLESSWSRARVGVEVRPLGGDELVAQTYVLM